MCGRTTQEFTWAEIHYLVGLQGQPSRANRQARYNIAPTTEVIFVREIEGNREIVTGRWGLIPHWFSMPLKEWKASTHNARVEGLQSSRSFASAWRRFQRCVVPFNFYEWTRPRKRGDPPHYIYPSKDYGAAFLMAGLWDEWVDPETGEVLTSCTVFTVQPNKFMSRIYNRMPVILHKDQVDDWFTSPPDQAYGMLRPCPDAWLEARKVSNYVNNSRNQGEDCIQPAPDELDL